MEDVVDYYLLKVAERDQRHGLSGKLTEGTRKFKTIIHRHDIASEIKKIRKSMQVLNQGKDLLGLQLPAPQTLQLLLLGGHFVPESQLVGIESNIRNLTDWLTNERPVMVVFGPAGIGNINSFSS
ncbi:hypothetical protein CR513_59881, partial [Mucuna pruriens]